LTAVRETADNSVELIPALARLSRGLRDRIVESLLSLRSGEPLAHVTTSLSGALKKCSQALRLEDVGRGHDAMVLLEEATQLDTGFAMAYRKLAAVLSNAGGTIDQQSTAATRAYQHRDRLPDLERYLATAYYFGVVRYDPGQIVPAYRAALAIDPENTV